MMQVKASDIYLLREIMKRVTLLVIYSLLHASLCIASGSNISPPVFIAHAGGSLNGQKYTNSLEALNLNYQKGHRFFEVDFSWTSDEGLVAIHDWGKNAEFFQKKFHVPSKII